MKQKPVDLSRRKVLKSGMAGVAFVSASGLISMTSAHAGSMPKLSEDDAAAKALKYKHDATQVDASVRSTKGVAQFCDNCKLYTGDKNAEWGKCSIFPGKLVNAKGWCTAWSFAP